LGERAHFRGPPPTLNPKPQFPDLHLQANKALKAATLKVGEPPIGRSSNYIG